jgi:ABC-type transport system involved in multi-copper enzyme maturation permease subunit
MLVRKELISTFLSPKFSATFVVCSLLMLLSVGMGIREYRSTKMQYAAAQELVREEMRQTHQWMELNNKIFREPNPLQIFVSGVENDIGRYSFISLWNPVKLVHSVYGDDPLFAVFRFLDFVFIVQVVLTLFGIFFTYDAICGERESGTLMLTFSNAVPRGRYIAAKFIGSWLGLALPIVVPILLSILLLFVFGIHMTTLQWVRLGGIICASILLFTFFVAFGIFISAVTRRSNVSFMISLVCWVAFVLIIPRVGVMLSGQMIPVPTVAEVESRQDRYVKDRWDIFMKSQDEVWKERENSMHGLSDAQRKAKRDEMQWTWAEADDKARKLVTIDIDENARKLKEEMRNRKVVQQQLAFLLSRISPVSAYQLAVMNMAGTDIDMKNRYEDGLTVYRSMFNKYKEQKQKESGGLGGVRISMDSKTGIKIETGRDIALDTGDMPQFQAAGIDFAASVQAAFPDFGILMVCSLLAFAGGFIAFLRYDVR